MNNANAAAKKRRANIQPEPERPQTIPQLQQPPATGLTLQQVVMLTDQRLTILENFMNKNIQNFNPMDNKETGSPEFSEKMDEFLDDANRKFEILAEEIAQVKDIVMKLQTYTMDVNKMLLEKLEVSNVSTEELPPDETTDIQQQQKEENDV